MKISTGVPGPAGRHDGVASEERRPVPVHEDGEIHALLGASPDVQIAMLRARGLPEAVTLVLVNSCENRCFFCASPGTTAVPPGDLTRMTRIRAHLEARPAGITRLVIGGNEPTLHPDFDRALALAHASGFEHVELMTSGMRLGDPDKLAEWKRLGLASVAVPIYAPSAELHDAVCGTASFDRLVRGLDAARDAGITIHLHTLLLKRTRHVLDELAHLSRARWGATLAIAPLRDKQQLFRFADEAVPLDETAALLTSLSAPTARLGMPLCVARGQAPASSLVMEIYFQTQRRRFASVCAGCTDRDGCPGVVDGQLDTFGEHGLSPRRAP